MKINRLSKFYYLKMLRLQGEPKALALGTAIGVFIGLTPTIPFHTVTIISIAMVTRTSAIAGVISSWSVCNPLTYIPIYYFSMRAGNWITPFELSWDRIHQLMDSFTSHQGVPHAIGAITGLGFETITVMILGGCIIALPFSIISYYCALYFFHRIRDKKSKRTK
jgi:uncharacterized protein (DUF2062 family)